MRALSWSGWRWLGPWSQGPRWWLEARYRGWRPGRPGWSGNRSGPGWSAAGRWRWCGWGARCSSLSGPAPAGRMYCAARREPTPGRCLRHVLLGDLHHLVVAHGDPEQATTSTGQHDRQSVERQPNVLGGAAGVAGCEGVAGDGGVGPYRQGAQPGVGVADVVVVGGRGFLVVFGGLPDGVVAPVKLDEVEG